MHGRRRCLQPSILSLGSDVDIDVDSVELLRLLELVLDVEEALSSGPREKADSDDDEDAEVETEGLLDRVDVEVDALLVDELGRTSMVVAGLRDRTSTRSEVLRGCDWFLRSCFEKDTRTV